MKRFFLYLALILGLAKPSYATDSQTPYTPSRYCNLLSEVTHSVALARDEGLTGNEVEQLLIKEGIRGDVIEEIINSVYTHKDISHLMLRKKVKESCLSLMNEKRQKRGPWCPWCYQLSKAPKFDDEYWDLKGLGVTEGPVLKVRRPQACALLRCIGVSANK